jgi:hypothetical protein
VLETIYLVLLFYADSTVIMAETADDFQKAINEFYLYCNEWKLQVNTDKITKLIFCIGPIPKKKPNDVAIENVKEFKYLGIIFSRSGSFIKAKKHLCKEAQKAMYKGRKKKKAI